MKKGTNPKIRPLMNRLRRVLEAARAFDSP